MKKIKINDAIMGSGKTTEAIKKMKSSKTPFIYVTPFLDEVNRIVDSVPDTFEPLVTSYVNCLDEKETVYKRENLLSLASKKLNLATTHSLFSNLHRKDFAFFKDYELILDEVITPIETIDMTVDDINIAFNEGLLTLNEETKEVCYTGDDYKGEFYAKLKTYCNTSNVLYVNDRLLIWAFPPEIFTSFKSITVLTYLFEGSLLAHYFKYYNIPFKTSGAITESEMDVRRKIKSQINIYEGNANKYGDSANAFSLNWINKRNSIDLKKIKTATANVLERKFDSCSSKTAFTTFKRFESKLKGKGYSKGFIPVNERATNKHAHKDTMIYLANRYLNPNIIDFFRSKEIEVNQDLWALSELLQWLWRGCIRNGESMNLYIPSKRMRTLLKNWLEESTVLTINRTA